MHNIIFNSLFPFLQKVYKYFALFVTYSILCFLPMQVSTESSFCLHNTVKADFRAVWLGSRISFFPNFSSLVCKGIYIYICCCSSVAQLCPTLYNPMDAACQASLSFTISQSLLKLMSIESMMPANHLILCCPFSSCPQSYPALGAFPVNWLFASGGQSTGA